MIPNALFKYSLHISIAFSLACVSAELFGKSIIFVFHPNSLTCITQVPLAWVVIVCYLYS